MCTVLILNFILATAFVVSRNNLYEVIPVLHKQWSLSVEINPAGVIEGDWSNIVHVGLGGNVQVYGDRTPGIWFNPGNTSLAIASAINDHVGYDTDFNTDFNITINEWTKVEVSQLLKSDEFHYTISIDGIVVYDIINNKTEVFNDVKVSSS